MVDGCYTFDDNLWYGYTLLVIVSIVCAFGVFVGIYSIVRFYMNSKQNLPASMRLGAVVINICLIINGIDYCTLWHINFYCQNFSRYLDLLHIIVGVSSASQFIGIVALYFVFCQRTRLTLKTPCMRLVFGFGMF